MARLPWHVRAVNRRLGRAGSRRPVVGDRPSSSRADLGAAARAASPSGRRGIRLQPDRSRRTYRLHLPRARDRRLSLAGPAAAALLGRLGLWHPAVSLHGDGPLGSARPRLDYARGAGGSGQRRHRHGAARAGRPASGPVSDLAVLAATLALGILVLAPLKRLADAVVFPGGRVSDADVADWRDQLAGATDTTELATIANVLLALRLNLPVVDDGPSLAVAGETVTLRGWNDAPPATRHVVDRFAGLVEETARRLAAAHRLVDVERRQDDRTGRTGRDRRARSAQPPGS